MPCNSHLVPADLAENWAAVGRWASTSDERFDVAIVSSCAALHAALSRWSTAPDPPAAAPLRWADHTKAPLTRRRACSLAAASTALVARSRS